MLCYVMVGTGIANELSIQLIKEYQLRTLQKNRKLSFVGTAERNIKFIWITSDTTMNLIST